MRALLASLFPGAVLCDVVPLSGGLANTNLRLKLDGEPSDLVLRIYQRDPGQLAKEAALARRLQGRLPVADFLHVEGDPGVLGAPFAIVNWIDGVTLDQILPDLTGEDLSGLGEQLGKALATIHGERFAVSGFFDGTLEVGNPIDVGGAGLIAYCREHLTSERVRERLGDRRVHNALAFVERHARMLDVWTGPPCLTHADFNGSNIMVRRVSEGLEVAAVLDWEFAFAGSPFFDLGNITRPPLGERSGFVAGLESGYRAYDDRLPENWQELARLADLTAWVDFATRPSLSDSVLMDVRAMIDRTIG